MSLAEFIRSRRDGSTLPAPPHLAAVVVLPAPRRGFVIILPPSREPMRVPEDAVRFYGWGGPGRGARKPRKGLTAHRAGQARLPR